ncbi:hypothetical protein OA86_12330 [Kaistella jeonii]|uniref:Uncharacterized protein n=1 Tax=Kaistella jeonii TaxID=266749 RepID=A0A0C1F4T0_9FLAO|nr:hypothetical protein OA86_12330 [Kaistella jeonii]
MQHRRGIFFISILNFNISFLNFFQRLSFCTLQDAINQRLNLFKFYTKNRKNYHIFPKLQFQLRNYETVF